MSPIPHPKREDCFDEESHHKKKKSGEPAASIAAVYVRADGDRMHIPVLALHRRLAHDI